MVLDVHLERYDGPLDLLIHLIHRHELDIFELSISEITDKFVEEIRLMQELDIDIAAEFIELASYLIYLKSRRMLPADFANLQEEEDPEAAFAGKLLEFTFAKELAENLQKRESLSLRFFIRRESLVIPREEVYREDPFTIADLFFRAGENKKEKKLVVEDMSKQAEAAAEKTRKMLLERRETLWSYLAGLFSGKFLQAVSFGTVLELSKQNEVNSYQPENFAEILIRSMKM
ncbi:MAG: segregation/condensation protein A [Deferribacteraceae bacterium]|nr:segregation/condensation protein A [Deferribacteraceae bacterium]